MSGLNEEEEEYVEVEFFVEEVFLVVDPSVSERANLPTRCNLVCDYGSIARPKLFGDDSERGSLPYFDVWERYYESESKFNGGSDDGAKGRKKIPVPAFDPSKVAVVNQRTSFGQGPIVSKRDRAWEEEQQDDVKKQEKELWERRLEAAKREKELEELRKTDPLKADKLLKKMAREEERELRKKEGADKKEKAKKKKKESSSSSSNKKDEVVTEGQKAEFKSHMAKAVTDALKPHWDKGRMADRESFKHLSRKLCKELLQKEQDRGNYKWNHKIAPAVERYVTSYMSKLESKGVAVYKKKESNQ